MALLNLLEVGTNVLYPKRSYFMMDKSSEINTKLETAIVEKDLCLMISGTFFITGKNGLIKGIYGIR